MTAHSRVTRTHPGKGAEIFRGLLALIFMLSLVGILPPEPAQAAQAAPQATTVIAALSDYGSGTTLEGTVATMIAGWNPARIVTAGDNYHYQSCNSYATCVGAYYGTYVTAQTFMPTMGNHDYDNPPVGLTAWNNYFTWLPTSPDAQRRWYDFVVGDVHFFMLDGNGNQADAERVAGDRRARVDIDVEHRGLAPGALLDRLLRRHRRLPVALRDLWHRLCDLRP